MTTRQILIDQIALTLYFAWVDQRLDCRYTDVQDKAIGDLAEEAANRNKRTREYMEQTSEKQWDLVVKAGHKEACTRIEKRAKVMSR